MKNTLKVSLFAILIISIAILFGFSNLSRSLKSIRHPNQIEVNGYAKRIVSSDLLEIMITINNKEEDIKKLNNKRKEDIKKLLVFLKEMGINENEISFVYNKAENKGESTTNYGTTNYSNQEKYYSSRDIILIKTKNLEVFPKFKKQINKLSNEGIVIAYEYQYKLTNIEKVKKELLDIAMQDAKNSAKQISTFFGKTIKEVRNIKDWGTVSIENETANNDWWNDISSKSSSKKKQIKLSIQVIFEYE